MLALPFIEIAGFIIVGSHIGVLATLSLVILSSMLGFFLLRVQGLGLLRNIQAEAAAGRSPDRQLIHGAMMALAAILLIIPGFFTSIVGLFLFIPFVRDLIWEKFVRGRIIVAGTTSYSQDYGQYRHGQEQIRDQVIDLDPEDYSSRPNDDSPWKRGPMDQ
ncbi:FxsA family protein [Daeguia caeni]|uniref:FxsA family protein n=1 Tax=Daeguia caeni TaxID=439612 RepID=A0ABV9H438_9HYPH